MAEATQIILNAILSAVGAAIFAGVCVWAKGLWKKSKNVDKAVKALAHDAYFRYCRYLLPEDTMTESELENLNYLYESYHSLGLNSTGDKLYRQITAKPVVRAKGEHKSTTQ